MKNLKQNRNKSDDVPQKFTENQVVFVSGKRNEKRTKDNIAYYWHIYVNGLHAGKAYISSVEDNLNPIHPEITVELNSEHRGKGIGTIAFRRGCILSPYDKVFASVRKSNLASRKALAKADFENFSDTPSKELLLVWKRDKSKTFNKIYIKKNDFTLNVIMDQLFRLFPDHLPYLLEDNDTSWTFSLMWHNNPLYFIDKKLSYSLKRIYNMSIEQMSSFYKLEKLNHADFILSMFHSRALLVVPLAFKRLGGRKFKYIIHVDSHHDLMPTLYNTKSVATLKESFFKSSLSLSNFSSALKSIDSGIVNKGNFLTTYLLAVKTGELIYVKPKTSNSSEVEKSLFFRNKDFKLGKQNFKGTGMYFSNNIKQGSLKIKETFSIPQHLKINKNEPVWLDIDLDYFCNRYDGDSDNKDKIVNISEKKELVAKINKFLVQLSKVNWKHNIEALSIATSPSFFPSEYWEITNRILWNGIKKILLT